MGSDKCGYRSPSAGTLGLKMARNGRTKDIYKGRFICIQTLSSHFLTISSQFFAIYTSIFQKTEVLMVSLRCWTGLNHNWFKVMTQNAYEVKTVGPFLSSQFSPVVFISLWAIVLKCFLLKMLRILKGQKWVARMSDALVSKRSELIKAFHLGLLKIEK